MKRQSRNGTMALVIAFFLAGTARASESKLSAALTEIRYREIE